MKIKVQILTDAGTLVAEAVLDPLKVPCRVYARGREEYIGEDSWLYGIEIRPLIHYEGYDPDYNRCP